MNRAIDSMNRLFHLFALHLAALLLVLTQSASARAQDDCQINSWLVTTYHHSLAFSQSLEQGSPQEAAVTLENHLALFSITSVRLSMRENGLADSEKLINKLIRTQNILLQVFALSGPQKTLLTAAKLGQGQMLDEVQKIVSAMRCPADPTWHPAEVGDSLGTSGAAIPASYLTLIILVALIVATLLTRQIMKYSARKQRQAKRHVCNIHARFLHSNARFDAKIVDISREGAKLRTETPKPGTVKCSVILLGHDTPAQIRWSNKTFTGVTFRHPLSADMLDTLLESPQSPAELLASKNKSGTRLGAALHE